MQAVQFLASGVAILALIVYWIFAFLILYHLTRFGVGVQPKRFAGVFLLGSILFFSAAVITLGNVDLGNLPQL